MELAEGGGGVMLSYLKITEGGGPLARRIYVFDRIGGGTDKLRVGFIGPHKHMPHKRTN